MFDVESIGGTDSHGQVKESSKQVGDFTSLMIHEINTQQSTVSGVKAQLDLALVSYNVGEITQAQFEQIKEVGQKRIEEIQGRNCKNKIGAILIQTKVMGVQTRLDLALVSYNVGEITQAQFEQISEAGQKQIEDIRTKDTSE